MFLCEELGNFPEKSISSICSLQKHTLSEDTICFEGLVMWGPRDLRAEKQAPERVVSRWFLSAGSIDDVSRLNSGFGFIRSWMKAKKTFLKRCVSAIAGITCTC